MFTLWWNRQDSAPVSDQHLVCYELRRSLIPITKKLGATKITEHLKCPFSPRFHIRNFLDSGFCSIEVRHLRLPGGPTDTYWYVTNTSSVMNKRCTQNGIYFGNKLKIYK